MVSELRNQQKLARLGLNRVGREITIFRSDGNATENKYNKITDGDKTWSQVAVETGRLTYQSMSERATEASVMGGRVDTEQPLIMLRDDTEAREGDRIVFEGFGDGLFGDDTFDNSKSFTLDERVPMDVFILYKAGLVQDG